MKIIKQKLPIAKYKNGNYTVQIFNEGTKIRESECNSFIPEFPECIDVNISNLCYNQCPFCYLNASPNGKTADFSDLEWLNSVHPYTELAINLNTLNQDGLDKFLEKCKSRNIIVNATVNIKNFDGKYITDLQKSNLIYAIGVSISKEDIDKVILIKDTPNIVFHTICGMFSINDYLQLSNLNVARVLILGYKLTGRGQNYFNNSILNNIYQLRNTENIQKLMKMFRFIAFDNLAIEQLELYKAVPNLMDNYMGDDGQFTFYLDLVSKTYSVSSTNKDISFPMTNNVTEMFQKVRNLKGHSND